MGDPPGDISAPGTGSFKARLWGVGLFVATACLLLAAIHWASSADQPEFSVARQWNEAVLKLGFEPLYPPVEDIAVGDVFAMITEDASKDSVTSEPFAGRSIKLMHLDMTQEIEETYREVYQFPATTPRPNHEGQIWPQSNSTESLFKVPATRNMLPLVLFPRFTITRAKHASGRISTLSWLWNGTIGADASSSETLEVRFSATETYGVPAIPAELKLIDFCSAQPTKDFCSDKGLRKQLSILVGQLIDAKVKDPGIRQERPRFSVEIALINRVFLARSIQTSIREDSATEGSGGLTGDGALPAVSAQPSSTGEDTTGSHTEVDANSRRANSAPTALHADANNIPGASISAERRATSNVLLPDTLLPRPVVVGFKSVRFKPTDQP
jgi:hypothetical protein